MQFYENNYENIGLIIIDSNLADGTGKVGVTKIRNFESNQQDSIDMNRKTKIKGSSYHFSQWEFKGSSEGRL